MKYVNFFLVLSIVVGMTGCASDYHYRGTIYLDTFPNQSVWATEVQETKEDVRLVRLATASYQTGEYDEALDAIDRAIDLKNYGTMGMTLRVTSKGMVNLMTTVEQIIKNRKKDPVTVTVKSVEKGGAADKAGIKEKDIIRSIGEIKINYLNLGEIKEYIKGKTPGTPVDVSIRGIRQKKTVVLERFKDPELPLKLGIKATVLALTGNADDAVKYANESLNSGQSNKASKYWAKTALGRVHIGNGNYDEAIKLLATVKDSIIARILEATAYAKQGDLQKAIDIYSAQPEEKISRSDRAALLVALAPYAASKEESAGTLRTQGRYREALKELGYVLRVADDARGREIYKTMAEILRGDPQLARVPEEARRYRLRGNVLMEEGNFKEAAAQYRQAVRAAPYIATLHFDTALAYGESKSYSPAVRYMKTYLLLAPEAPNARAVKDQIYKWEFKMEKED